jgi:DNA-binding PadR family transcriptional regulator
MSEGVLEQEVLKEMQRNMVKDFLDTIILAKLRNSNSFCGYDILEYINEKFSCFMSPGTVYAVLYSMERRGLVKGEFAEGKRVYTLTTQGEETIATLLKLEKEIQAFFSTFLKV